MSLIEEIRLKSETEFLVLLEEEFGYRSWFWFPSMNSETLEQWWTDLQTVSPYFMTPEPLPGTLYQVKGDSELQLYSDLQKSSKLYSAHTHCDDDSSLIRPDGSRIYHRGYEAQ